MIAVDIRKILNLRDIITILISFTVGFFVGQYISFGNILSAGFGVVITLFEVLFRLFEHRENNKKEQRKIEEQKAEQEAKQKLKDINDRLDLICSPMVNIIKTFQKERGIASYSSDSIKDTGELVHALDELEEKIETTTTIYKPDDKIWEIKRKICGFKSNTNDNLRTFLNDIKDIMKELQIEKRKYELRVNGKS
ncbi:Uncharacterised protein [uncultured archaeon]|nr:Uncharacterised protein [uncultured archaeon]